MTAVLYEVEVTAGPGGLPETGTWLDHALRQVLESEGFESGRAYRAVSSSGVESGHLALQFRVRSEAELARWVETASAAFLADLAGRCGPDAVVITRQLLAASELATPADTIGSQTVTECPNCGARVDGKFCAACGQDNNVSVVGFHRLIGDFIRDFFNFDSRLFNSIWPLLAKPGFLTVEYLAGRRATYLPPVRMTLFLSIVFFGLVAWQADGAMAVRMTGPSPAASTGTSTDPAANSRLFSLEFGDNDRIELTAAESGWLKSIEDRSSANLHRLGKDGEYQREVLQKAIGYLPMMMFMLLPVFAFILKILHLRSGRYYVEHLIHSMHVHAFNFLTLSVIVGLSMVPSVRAASASVPGWAWSVWWLYFLLYPWLAMRRTYAQGFFKTTLKFALSSLVYVMLLATGTVAMAVYSLSV